VEFLPGPASRGGGGGASVGGIAKRWAFGLSTDAKGVAAFHSLTMSLTMSQIGAEL
jgi:hypothetical protein